MPVGRPRHSPESGSHPEQVGPPSGGGRVLFCDFLTPSGALPRECVPRSLGLASDMRRLRGRLTPGSRFSGARRAPRGSRAVSRAARGVGHRARDRRRRRRSSHGQQELASGAGREMRAAVVGADRPLRSFRTAPASCRGWHRALRAGALPPTAAVEVEVDREHHTPYGRLRSDGAVRRSPSLAAVRHARGARALEERPGAGSWQPRADA